MGGRKRLEDLTIADDFMFGKIMGQEDVAKHFLEALYGKTIKSIQRVTTQSVVKNSFSSKAVRFDVEFVGDGTIYDIEMENSMSGEALYKRARYYQSSLDMRYLQADAEYTELPNTRVIFVCTFDHFGCGYAKYTQIPTIVETGKAVPSGAEVLYLNTQFSVSNVEDDIEAFLELIENPDGGEWMYNWFAHSVYQKVENAKMDETVRREFMSFDEYVQRERKEAAAKAAEEERRANAEVFSQISGIPVDKILKQLEKTKGSSDLKDLYFNS